MSQNIPPPPEAKAIPPPSEGDFSHIPPPSGDEHVNDVLDRKKKFSWKNFGGDGFLVSVAFHVLLAIIALFYIVSRYQASKKNTEPEVFATGAGGGSRGEKPKAFEHQLRTPKTNVKMPSRITSKSAGAVSLPDTPQTGMASFASGLASGAMSKGLGGGSGGGLGAGIGIGRGNGKNFVSLFGVRGTDAPGLSGAFFDCKQDPKGRPTKYEPDTSCEAYVSEVLQPLVRSWNEASLERHFFKAPESLVASRIFIPTGSADGAPKAYGVEDKVKPSRWIAWYKGVVTAPKTGRFRFWGVGDDALVVRWNKRPVLDAGYRLLTETGKTSYYGTVGNARVLGVNETKKGNPGAPFRAGPWLKVERGAEYPIEILISEIPGGGFAAWVLMEESDEAHPRGDGKLFLFRMTGEPVPADLKNNSGLEIDMTGKGLVWNGKGKAVRSAGPVR